MKKLSKIIMIQWYLFDAEELRVNGATAIVGANAAGKSSILDGVQIVLAGGNKNKIGLNKGSNEGGKREIREYCLGIINDPKSHQRSLERTSANTYLALCLKMRTPVIPTQPAWLSVPQSPKLKRRFVGTLSPMAGR